MQFSFTSISILCHNILFACLLFYKHTKCFLYVKDYAFILIFEWKYQKFLLKVMLLVLIFLVYFD